MVQRPADDLITGYYVESAETFIQRDLRGEKHKPK